MRPLIPLLLIASVCSTQAKEIDIGAGTIDLPAGWVVLEDRRDCLVGETGIQNGFRNAEGTIWIISSVISPESMDRMKITTSHWAVSEHGNISGHDYMVLLKPEHEQSPFIVFPQLRAYFSVMLTEKGFADPEEAFRWWTPPKGDQFNKKFEEAKRILFSTYAPSESSTGKTK